MSYIGQRPVVGRYIKLDQISSGFNGSETSFSMTAGSQAVFPGTARNLLLSLGGVIQEPDTNFTISGSTLTFTTAPVANTTFFAVIFGDMQSTGTPSDGTVLPASIASSGNFSFPQLTVTGTSSLGDDVTFTGANYNVLWDKSDNALEFADNAKAVFGIGSDLLIYHDGTSNIITSINGNFFLQAASGENGITINQNGAVDLYYDNSKKFETTSSGVTVTGGVAVTGNISVGSDTGKLYLGASNDLEIYHTGSNSNSNIRHINSAGSLYIDSANSTYFRHYIDSGGTISFETFAVFNDDGAVELYHNNSKKLETVTGGVYVYGDLGFGIGTTGNLFGGDNDKVILGSGSDLQIYHDGTNSFLVNGANGGILYLQAYGENSLKAHPNGQVELFYDASKKFETLTSGVQVTGSAIVDGTGTQTTTVTLKNGTDTSGTKLGHSSNSDRGFIQVTESGADFGIQVGGANTSNMRLELFGDTTTASRICLGTEEMITAAPNGAVQLYFDNSLKLNTTANGVTCQDDLAVLDGNKLTFGNSDDMQLYHDGTNSFIKNSTGYLNVNANLLYLGNQANNETYILAQQNGSVNLYYDNSLKFETTSSGTRTTGAVHVNDGSTTGNRISVGNGGDLKIYHTNPGSYIDDDSLALSISSQRIDLVSDDGENMARFYKDAQVELYHNNSKKLNTLSAGVNVEGQIIIDHTSGTDGKGEIAFGESGRPFIDGFDNGNHGSAAGFDFRAGNGDYFIKTRQDAAVELYYDNSKKFETTSDGAVVAGGLNIMPSSSSFVTVNKEGTGILVSLRTTGTERGNISSNGSTVAFNTTSSDKSMKKNFEDWTENTLTLFKNINPQKFNFLDQEDGTNKEKGFIAQDLVTSFPEAYPKNDEGKYVFNPSGMVVYLMKAIQELEAEVAALKAA